MLLIGTMTFSITGQKTISSDIKKNYDETITKKILVDRNTYPMNNWVGIDDFIYGIMSAAHIPGLSATIVKNDDIFWTNSYGYANISDEKLVENTTLFYHASVSKTITATAIMQLYEQGIFDLNSSINDYLPFEVKHPDYPEINITFLMLLTHTSSIQDNDNYITYITGDPTVPLGEFLEEYFTPEGEYYNPDLNFYPSAPGNSFVYTNAGAGLIGYLVEHISGDMFYEYCNNNIFEPLDMPETAWFLADLNISNIAVPYYWTGDEYEPIAHYSRNVYPATTLRSSITQICHFLMMMMNGGEYNSTQILQESTVELMLTQHSGVMGIIWWKGTLDGRTIWYHLGTTQGCRTIIAIEPATNIGVIILTNSAHNYITTIASKLFDYAENQPPYTPSNPEPENGETNVNINIELSWTGGDPNEDTVHYDVYFGTTNPPPRVKRNQSDTTYDPGLLNYTTKYYWRIIAWDEWTSTSGPLWDFTTRNEPDQIPDLNCNGNINWVDVKPGSTVVDSFYIENIGDPESYLNWEIIDWPNWGSGSSWNFTPKSGLDLTPEEGEITIEVEVVAPDEKNTEFTGEVKIINSENPSDYCTIDIVLKTPNRTFYLKNSILYWLIECFPNAFPLLKCVLD